MTSILCDFMMYHYYHTVFRTCTRIDDLDSCALVVVQLEMKGFPSRVPNCLDRLRDSTYGTTTRTKRTVLDHAPPLESTEY